MTETNPVLSSLSNSFKNVWKDDGDKAKQNKTETKPVSGLMRKASLLAAPGGSLDPSYKPLVRDLILSDDPVVREALESEDKDSCARLTTYLSKYITTQQKLKEANQATKHNTLKHDNVPKEKNSNQTPVQNYQQLKLESSVSGKVVTENAYGNFVDIKNNYVHPPFAPNGQTPSYTPVSNGLNFNVNPSMFTSSTMAYRPPKFPAQQSSSPLQVTMVPPPLPSQLTTAQVNFAPLAHHGIFPNPQLNHLQPVTTQINVGANLQMPPIPPEHSKLYQGPVMNNYAHQTENRSNFIPPPFPTAATSVMETNVSVQQLENVKVNSKRERPHSMNNFTSFRESNRARQNQHIPQQTEANAVNMMMSLGVGAFSGPNNNNLNAYALPHSAAKLNHYVLNSNRPSAVNTNPLVNVVALQPNTNSPIQANALNAKKTATARISKGTEKSNQTTPRRWTEEEDNLLRAAVHKYKAKNWKLISAEVPGRTNVQCLQRWRKALDPHVIKGHWTQEEDTRLIMLVNENPKNWGHVARGIPGRTAKQCRERYHNHLDPSIKKGDWTQEEDCIIIAQQMVLGNKWAEISKSLPGRTENSVKIRWKSIKRQEKSNKNLSLQRAAQVMAVAATVIPGKSEQPRRKNQRPGPRFANILPSTAASQ